MLRIHISAIIFDYGQVLCSSPLSSEIDAMASLLRLPVPDFQRNYWRDRLAYDRAALDPATYWNTVAQRPLPQHEVDQVQEIDSASWAHPNRLMPEWARQVRAAGFRIALLSNMPWPVRDYIIRCPWLPQFDHATFSCDLHVAKPAPEIYRHSLAGVDAAPADALLIDDRPENIRAAQALGIHAILFTTPEEFAPELDRRFAIGVPLVATVNRGNDKNQ